MSRSTAQVCEQRAMEERHAADEASCDEAKIVHRELERQYAAEAHGPRSNGEAPAGGKRKRPLLSLRS